MSWFPSHPGGIITCDAPTCDRKRRHYCPPSERDAWIELMAGARVIDFCPAHRDAKDSFHG